jgi:hypothetical protein
VSACRSQNRQTPLIGGVLAVLAMMTIGSIAARRPAAIASPPPVELPDTISFPVEYAGIGAEGVDLIWRGQVGGPSGGRVTIRMEYAGAPADRRMPIWPVNAWLFYSADHYRGSFVAELSGSMNWRTLDLRVTGLVSDGYRSDWPLEQRIRLSQPGLGGTATVRFLPRVAGSREILSVGSAD